MYVGALGYGARADRCCTAVLFGLCSLSSATAEVTSDVSQTSGRRCSNLYYTWHKNIGTFGICMYICTYIAQTHDSSASKAVNSVEISSGRGNLPRWASFPERQRLHFVLFGNKKINQTYLLCSRVIRGALKARQTNRRFVGARSSEPVLCRKVSRFGVGCSAPTSGAALGMSAGSSGISYIAQFTLTATFLRD